MKVAKYCCVFIILSVSFGCSEAIKRGKCNQCMENGIACLDEFRFATCFNGALTNNVNTCPGNGVCTEDTQICRSPAEGFEAICYEDYCGTCELTGGVFACLDETRYGYCFGGMEPIAGTIRVCPPGRVCNYNDPEVVCAPMATSSPSCIPVPEPTTTEDPLSTMTTDDVTATTDDNTSITEDSSATTEDPSNTTEDPSNTTEDPSNTTEDPSKTTEDPSNTTEDPSNTTEDPSNATEDPSNTTEDPSNTTEDPSNTTEDPSKTTEDPSNTTEDPSNTTEDPSNTTEDPSNTTEDPSATTDSTMTTNDDSTSTLTTVTTEITTDGPTESTVDPITPTSSEITPTDGPTSTAAPLDPATFCSDMQTTGYFRPKGDPTCKEYIYCYLLSGQYLGRKYTCAGYYNAVTRKCQNDKPDDCDV